jgi:hypothetical protein
MDQLTYAKLYATQKHGDQMYGVLHYTHHLADVERILSTHGAVPMKAFPSDWMLIDKQSKIISRYSEKEFSIIEIKNGDRFHSDDMFFIKVLDHSQECTKNIYQEDTDLYYIRDRDDNLSAMDMFVAAWLHDVIEDTDTKYRDVEELFGHNVAQLVDAVTSVEGPNRKLRNAATYPKIRNAGIWAVRLKLADRIANVSNGGGSVKMYKDEYKDFRHALYTAGENEDLWFTLDCLING